MLDSHLLFVEALGGHDLDVLSMLDDDPGPSERLRARLRANPEVIEAYLADSRLFDLLFGGSESDRIRVLTPALAFAVLVHRAIEDLRSANHVSEWVGAGERLPVFDVDSLREFIEDTTRRFMVIELLASFTSVASGSTWVQTTRGYRRRRFSELDPASLAELVESLPRERRAAGYRRLGDVTLFLTGVFPDHTARHPIGVIGQARLARATGIGADWSGGAEYLRFLERAGRHWYERALDMSLPAMDVGGPLQDFAANFTRARRFLNYLGDRHLHRFDTGLMHPFG